MARSSCTSRLWNDWNGSLSMITSGSTPVISTPPPQPNLALYIPHCGAAARPPSTNLFDDDPQIPPPHVRVPITLPIPSSDRPRATPSPLLAVSSSTSTTTLPRKANCSSQSISPLRWSPDRGAQYMKACRWRAARIQESILPP